MVRKLKFHEQKLLKKVDFISWKLDNNIHEIAILRRYKIQKRDDYTKYIDFLWLNLCNWVTKLYDTILYLRYCRLAMQIQNLARSIKELDPKDPFRVDSSASLLEKL